MKVLLTWREVYAAAQVGVFRNVHATSLGREPKFRPDRDPELWSAHIHGAIAEKAVAAAAGIPDFTPSHYPDRDAGDVCGWEVRWTGGQHPHLRVGPYDPDERACVLVTGQLHNGSENPTGVIYTIHGWLSANEARARGRHYEDGSVRVPLDALIAGLPPFRTDLGHDPRAQRSAAL